MRANEFFQDQGVTQHRTEPGYRDCMGIPGLTEEMKRYGFRVFKKNETELIVDKAVTKKMMLHLQKFLKDKHKTRKRRRKKYRVSKKNRS